MEISVNQRLGIFLKLTKISQGDFAKSLETSRTSISAIISGGRNLSSGMLARIEKQYPQLNIDWLLKGEGEMLNSESVRLVPHYPATVSAGFLGGNSEAVTREDVEYRERMKQFKHYDFTISVSGSSMNPTFHSGDILACKNIFNASEMKPGNYYVFDSREGAVVKRLLSQTNNVFNLHSDNPEYPDQKLCVDDVFGIAEVVGSINTNPDKQKESVKQEVATFKEAVERVIENMDDISKKDLLNYIRKIWMSKYENL